VILSNIYLNCRTGEAIGLMGRNGSGKSCILNIIFGTLHGENQSVRLNGRYYHQLFTQNSAIHFMPQDGFLMDYLCFNDLVKIFDLGSNLEKIYDIDEITNNSNIKLRELSGGIKKLIEIVAVIYSGTHFAILDEPFSYLSPVLVEKIITHIRQQAKFKGIILTDHQYKSIFKACDRYYCLSDSILNEIYKISDLEKYGYILSDIKDHNTT